MIGTLVNAAAVVAGGLVGVAAKKWIRQELSDSCMKVIGLAVTLIGLSNALSYMLSADGSGVLAVDGGLLLLISMVLGTLLGELLRLDAHITRLSGWVERRLRMEGFARGFLNATLLFCVGAMTIVGAFNDGLNHDPSLLFVKSAIDCASAVFLAAAMGIGVACAAVPLLLYQGALTLCAGLLAPVLTGATLNAVCMVGFVMIVAIGLNLMEVTAFKTANMLPALVVVVLLKQLPWF